MIDSYTEEPLLRLTHPSSVDAITALRPIVLVVAETSGEQPPPPMMI
jgi:hypothetical protein